MRSFTRVLAALMLGVLTGSARVSAQAPLAPVSIDSVMAMTMDTIIAVGRLPVELPLLDRNIAAVFRNLERTGPWFAERNRTALERTLIGLEGDVARDRKSPWPRYAMARIFEQMHLDRLVPLQSAGKRPGERHVEAYWRLAEEALVLAPDSPLIRQRMIRHLALGGDRELTKQMSRLLRNELARSDAFTEAWLVEGRRLRTDRRYEEALAAFERAATGGYDSVITGIERARTLAALDRGDEAVASYRNATAAISDEGRMLVRQDLGWILDADSLAAFDSVPNGRLPRWLELFWAERDAAVLEAAGTRVLEHMRRWNAAHVRYRVPNPQRRTQFTRVDVLFDPWHECIASSREFYANLSIYPPTLPGDLRSDEPLLDHRARILIKHGNPFTSNVPAVPITGLADTEDLLADPFTPEDAERSSGEIRAINEEDVATSVSTTELWIYWMEGRWRLISFRGSHALGRHAGTTLSAYLPLHVATWAALATALPEFAPVAAQIERRIFTPPGCRTGVYAAIEQQREDTEIGLATDSDVPPIRTPWNVSVRNFALSSPSPGDGGRLLVTWAVPHEVLKPDTLDDGRLLWNIDFRMTLFRNDDGRSLLIDTTRRVASRRLNQGDHLTGWFEIPLPSGQWQFAMLTSQGDSTAGHYLLRRGIRIEDGRGLTLSDVVTGMEGEPGWTGAWDEPFPVQTRGVWSTTSAADLYFEVGGLSPGEEYRTAIQVIPVQQRGGRRVEVTTTDRAPAERFAIRRSLGLTQLAPGSYDLSVTITAGGREVRREQRIVIR